MRYISDCANVLLNCWFLMYAVPNNKLLFYFFLFLYHGIVINCFPQVYKCIQKNCDLAFDDLDSFLDHIRTHDRDLQYRCHTCSKVFSSLKTLGFHQYEHSMYPQPKKTVGPRWVVLSLKWICLAAGQVLPQDFAGVVVQHSV